MKGNATSRGGRDLLRSRPHPTNSPRSAARRNFFLERWRTPECVIDAMPNAVWSIAAERVQGQNPARGIERLYVMVGRVGIRILEFDPTEDPGSRLVDVGGIEVPNGSGGLHIRDDLVSGITDLLVVDRDSGVRVFGR